MQRLVHKTPFFYGWVILSAAGASMFVRNALASLTLAVFVYPISQELGWSRTLIGGAAGLGGLLSIIGAPPVGWAVDRFGARQVLTIAVLLLGLSTISLAWATTPVAFYLAYGLGRVLFTGPIPIGASVVVARWFVRKRGRAIGILSFGHAGGMILFPAIASVVIQLRGWQEAWLVMGVLVLVIALAPVALFIIQRPEDVGLAPDGGQLAPALDTKLDPELDPAESGSPSRPAAGEPVWSVRQAMRTPVLWMLALATGAVYFIQSGTNLHQGAYFVDQGLSKATADVAIILSAVGAAFGTLAWGWMSEKMPVRYVFAAVALLMAISIALFTTVDTAAEAYGYAFLFGAAVGGIIVVPPVAYADYFGRQSLGAIRGVTEPFVALGQAIGSVLSGVVFDATGTYQSAFLAYSVLGISVMLLLLLAKPPSAKPPQAIAIAAEEPIPG